MTAERDLLLKNGYCRIPRVLNAAQVEELRGACLTEFCNLGLDSTSYVQIPASRFVADPQIARIPFQPAIVNTLRALLGETYITIPEFTVLANSFGGWHRDSSSQGYAPHLFQRDYLQVTCAIYLQDNDSRYGGGLDLKPRSHREMFRVGKPQFKLRRLARRLQSDWLRRAESIDTQTGDLLVFQFNVLHRATPRTQAQDEPARLKLGIFWGACAHNSHAQLYMQHMQTRKDNPFYADLTTVKYPDNYHIEAVDLIRQQGLTVATY